MSAFIYNL